MTTTERQWYPTAQRELLTRESCPEGHNWTTTDAVETAIAELVWMEVPEDGILGDMAGGLMGALALKAAVDELRIPKVSRFAVGVLPCWSDHETGELCYGLLGIEGNYKNGQAQIYIADRGSDLLPIGADFTPKEGG